MRVSGADVGEMQINKEENKRKILSRVLFVVSRARCRVLFSRVVSIPTKGRPDNYVAVATVLTAHPLSLLQRRQEVNGYSLARRTTSRDEVASSVCRVSWVIRLHRSHNFPTARAPNATKHLVTEKRENGLSAYLTPRKS